MRGDRSSLTSPPELESEITSAVRAFVESLLAMIADQRREIEELRARHRRVSDERGSAEGFAGMVTCNWEQGCLLKSIIRC